MDKTQVVLHLAVVTCCLLLSLTSPSEAACNPSDSAPNSSVTVSTDTGSGSTCYFPFTDSPTTYSDCTEYCSGSVCRYWCATSCDYASNGGLWRYCSYRLSDLTLPNCSSLAAAAPSAEPSALYAGSGSGTQCVFPFLYNGQCHHDCLTTSSQPWCATTTEGALVDYNYKYCAYTLAGAATPECASLSASTPAYITPQLSSYHVSYNQSDPYANCTFPFYYNGKCYDDCTSGAGFPWYLIWCITERYYEPNRRIRFCPYFRKYASMKSLPLRWGFYRIYLQTGCGSGGALCNASIAPANATAPLASQGSRRLGLSQLATEAQMWEAMPQPNGFFIFRTVVPCYTPADAWSTDSTDATFENITQEREFWTVSSVGGSGGSGLYTIQSAYNATAGYYLSPASVSGYSVLTVQSGVSSTWLFEEITDMEKSQLSVCDQLDINGAWCAWSNYTRVGDWQVRSRNCSCPAQAGNGTACPGNSTEHELVVNGTWCSWSGYQPAGGGSYATRMRVCNCSAPVFGGLDCPGSDNDTGLVVSGVWCTWSNYTVTGDWGSRMRACACPEPAYGGANCSGSDNDTGSVVNGTWCSWSAYTVAGSVGSRTRLCNCSGPAYGGADCPGSAVDSGTVLNGTWCDWSTYQVSTDGATGTRLRLCNCTSPAYGGADCPGSGNDTGGVVNGTWCAWSDYQVSGPYSTRVRICNCSAPAYGGEACPGNGSETYSVVNGTWCPWGPYVVSGANSTRTRLCNCSAPEFGGLTCPGQSNETQAVVNGSWCSWGPYNVSGLYGSRFRSCACPLPDFGGADCVGSSNDTGLLVNGSWCAWGPYIVSGSYATRMRNCSCPESAYGGSDCAGSANDTGAVVPGAWCSWSSYSLSGSYGTRLRDCNCTAPSYAGADCPGSGNDTGLTQDVAWCAWSAYVVSAGVGTRSRNCSCPPAPAYGGSAACTTGASNDTGLAVDAVWCVWSAYADDGAGNETRRRNCSCPTSAYGGTADCPGGVGVESRVIANGSWCAWSGYTMSGSWGLRNRTCGCPAPTVLGTPCPGNDTDQLAQVNGTWCAWSALIYGYGEVLRTRSCNCTASNAIGADCPGNWTERYPCNSSACAATTPASVNGAWCGWSAWSPGPVNSGYMLRARNCSCPAAAGGSTCPGSGTDQGICVLTPCRRYMAVPEGPGSVGASVSELSGYSKLVGLVGAVCAAALVALAVGVGLTLWKVTAASAAAAGGAAASGASARA